MTRREHPADNGWPNAAELTRHVKDAVEMAETKSMGRRALLSCVVTVICLIGGVAVLAVDRTADQTQPSTAKWQHLALTHQVDGDVSDDDLGRRIMKLGQEGWELVTVENFSESGTTTRTVFYFKRRL